MQTMVGIFIGAAVMVQRSASILSSLTNGNEPLRNLEVVPKQQHAE
jgi:hypothetical protein